MEAKLILLHLDPSDRPSVCAVIRITAGLHFQKLFPCIYYIPSGDIGKYTAMAKILFISNGHGEDLNASIIAEALRRLYPSWELSAMPLVGQGNAYRRQDIPIICPTRSLPSGGFVYMDWRQLWRDLQSGLLSLTWQQLSIIRQVARLKNYDLVLAVGDIVPLIFVYLSKIPFMSYLVSTSAHYENKLILPLTARWILHSQRCLGIFARDIYTARLMSEQGFRHTLCLGYPIMDVLHQQGKDLHLAEGQAVICLLCGSRLPEAQANLLLLLQVVDGAQRLGLNWQFRAAIVPQMGGEVLQTTAEMAGWTYTNQGDGEVLTNRRSGAQVYCFRDAFADILHRADVVLGMAGTAIEQAVGLGKPVVQLVGKGPQFTYRFAEAQQRLLGESVQTCSKPEVAVALIQKVLADPVYQERCKINGQERVGGAGGAERIAREIAQQVAEG